MQLKNSDNINHTTNNIKLEEERNEIKTKEAESAISPTKKGIKRKIEKQQIIKDSSRKPAAQKTRKLNPPPNLVSRNKKKHKTRKFKRRRKRFTRRARRKKTKI